MELRPPRWSRPMVGDPSQLRGKSPMKVLGTFQSTSKFEVKIILIVFFDTDGVVCVEFLPRGRIVYVVYCVGVVKRLMVVHMRKDIEVTVNRGIRMFSEQEANKAISLSIKKRANGKSAIIEISGLFRQTSMMRIHAPFANSSQPHVFIWTVF